MTRQQVCRVAVALAIWWAGYSIAAEDTLPDEQRAVRMSETDLVPTSCTFDTDEFPAIDFKDPAAIRELIGDYTLRPTFFNSEYQQVTNAVEPGRYGAVIQLVPADAARFQSGRRFITLYRLPDQTNIERQPKAVQDRFKRGESLRIPGPSQDIGVCKELAGLHEVTPGADPNSFYEEGRWKDTLWWAGMRRRLYGFDKAYPKPFVGPVPIEGAPARVVREGTLEEAGMKPDAAEKIDAVLTQWAADSDQGFDVCITRHGVIAFSKAYGNRFRSTEPRTTKSKSNLTSTSKLISGTMIMMLVDQGWLELDRPITDLPGPLHGLRTKKPLTLMHLYTHTSGFNSGCGLWTDGEERVAPILPYLNVGEQWGYNSINLELPWSLIGGMTGESITYFALHHLLTPLGCTNTDIMSSGGSNLTTARDMARICQVLLNGGAYGNYRFFSRETFEKMLPRRLTKTLGQDTDDRLWGIGTMPWPVRGLSDLTFGHGGYTKCTVAIDPANDLAIIMLRDDAGSNFKQYNPLFLQAVVDGLTDALPLFPSEALSFAGCRAPLADGRITLDTVVTNTSTIAAVIEFEYRSTGKNWTIEPSQGRIELPPGGKAPLHIEATFAKDQPAPIPQLWGSVSRAGQTMPKFEYWLRPHLERQTTVARLTSTPALDGVIGENEYAGAATAGGFIDPKGREKPPFDTRFTVACDEKTLYVAVTAFEDNPATLKQSAAERDDRKIQADDCIELILGAGGAATNTRHFAVNLSNAKLDALGGDSKNWDTEWDSAVKIYDDRYVMEFAIPFKSLGIATPKPGDRLAMNICRHRTACKPYAVEANSQWVSSYDKQTGRTAIWGSYDDPEVDHYFGVLAF